MPKHQESTNFDSAIAHQVLQLIVVAFLLQSCSMGRKLVFVGTSLQQSQSSSSSHGYVPGGSSAPAGSASPDAGFGSAPSPSSGALPGSLSAPASPGATSYRTEAQALDAFSQGAASVKEICSQGNTNFVTKAFCGATPPVIHSLADLQKTLGLDFKNLDGENVNGNPAFVLTGHSSSLVSRSVSAINPRTIMSTYNPNRDGALFVAMGFVRGEGLAELVTEDEKTSAMTFYLFSQKKACDLTNTCTNYDMLTPEAEKNWVSYSIYEERTLKNTVLDCLQCHQSKGPGTLKILRMQELTSPWTHFFKTDTAGAALIGDFHAAHGSQEDYGGVPAALIDQSFPFSLQGLVAGHGMSPEQVNEFPTQPIESEVQSSSPAQPSNNDVAGQSGLWQQLFAGFVNGDLIAPPYHDVKITDSTKLAKYTKAYSDVMAGRLPRAQLPDIRKIFPDDPLRLAEMGFRPLPGEPADKMIVHMCAQCHNSRLDQSLSRAKFNALTLGAMSREEKDKAIVRINSPEDSLTLMPPRRFRELSADEKKTMTDFLKK